MRHSRRGFTWIELLIIVAIAVCIAVLLADKYRRSSLRSQPAAQVVEMEGWKVRAVLTAIERYRTKSDFELDGIRLRLVARDSQNEIQIELLDEEGNILSSWFATKGGEIFEVSSGDR